MLEIERGLFSSLVILSLSSSLFQVSVCLNRVNPAPKQAFSFASGSRQKPHFRAFAKTSMDAPADSLVSASWLKENSPVVKVLDASW